MTSRAELGGEQHGTLPGSESTLQCPVLLPRRSGLLHDAAGLLLCSEYQLARVAHPPGVVLVPGRSTMDILVISRQNRDGECIVSLSHFFRRLVYSVFRVPRASPVSARGAHGAKFTIINRQGAG